MVYEQSSGIGFGKILLILLIIGIIFVASLFYFQILNLSRVFSWFGYQQLPSSIIKQQAQSASLSNTVETPDCQRQNIQISSDTTKPVSMTIIGKDLTLNCCWMSTTGYLCNNDKLVTISQCRNGMIGGEILYTFQDSQFIDNNIGIGLISQLRKTSIC